MKAIETTHQKFEKNEKDDEEEEEETRRKEEENKQKLALEANVDEPVRLQNEADRRKVEE